MKRNEFNEYRFSGLNHRKSSNKYMTMDRVSEDENKIVVKVEDVHLIQTKYGYALILDHTHVVFLKDWQVSQNFFGNEVLLNKEYFIVKEWGEHQNFSNDDNVLNFEHWLNVAKQQNNLIDENGYKCNKVKWEM